MEGSAVLVERVVLASAAAVEFDLDALASDIERVAGEADHVEGIHHRGRCRDLFGGGGFEAGEPVHRHDLHAVAPFLGLGGEPSLEGLRGAAFDHGQQPAGTGCGAHGGEVDHHGHVSVAAAGVTPHVLVDTDHAHAVETGGVVDEKSPAFGQDSVVRGIPSDAEGPGDGTHREVVDHQGFECPPQRAVRQTRARLRRARQVLAPDVAAAAALVAAAASPVAGWGATRTGHVPTLGSRCHVPCRGSRSGDTSHPVRPGGRPTPRFRDSDADR